MEEENNIFNNATLKDGFAGDRRYLKGFLAKIELVPFSPALSLLYLLSEPDPL